MVRINFKEWKKLYFWRPTCEHNQIYFILNSFSLQRDSVSRFRTINIFAYMFCWFWAKFIVWFEFIKKNISNSQNTQWSFSNTVNDIFILYCIGWISNFYLTGILCSKKIFSRKWEQCSNRYHDFISLFCSLANFYCIYIFRVSVLYWIFDYLKKKLFCSSTIGKSSWFIVY